MEIKNSLPKFPHFTRLDIHHKDILSAIANRFPSYSDFNFISLFSWDTDESIMISELNGNLVVRFRDYESDKNFYSFIGDNLVDQTVQELLEYVRNNGHEAELMLMPQDVISQISQHHLHEVIEDRDNHDYILSVPDLVEFKTNTYRGKKNLLNRFSIKYGPQSRTVELDLNEHEICQQIRGVLESWRQSRGKNNAEVKKEVTAIERSLNHADQLGLKAYGVYVDKQLIGFTLFEILPRKVAMIHFDKADIRFEGVFEYLKHNLAKHLAALDIDTINYQQDLGVEGLRRAKESYHPIDYLKKYRIRARH